MAEEAGLYYKSLFCSSNEGPADHYFNLYGEHTTRENDVLSLNNPVTKEEVSKALHSIKPYKAPWPDGFQTIFYKQYWHIIGDEVWHLVAEAFSTGYFDPTISQALIDIIPKLDNSGNFMKFKPISLCNVLYKTITNVLVNRLRPILNNLTGPLQNSFLPGRGTQDNALVLQEIIHSMNKSKSKKGSLIFKLDLEKAYDNMDWTCLKRCLEDFGFPINVINLIMFCVTSSSMTLLWNGEKLQPFSPTRGLR